MLVLRRVLELKLARESRAAAPLCVAVGSSSDSLPEACELTLEARLSSPSEATLLRRWWADDLRPSSTSAGSSEWRRDVRWVMDTSDAWLSLIVSRMTDRSPLIADTVVDCWLLQRAGGMMD